MKISVDTERCQGHNRCCALAPDLFVIDDLGYATASSTGDLDPSDERDAQLAAANCPEHAIRLDD
ncbi:MAG: ferredoxin [Actinobacteria bacterium]|nr:ferredoxin [Actinomycetota bacterium]